MAKRQFIIERSIFSINKKWIIRSDGNLNIVCYKKSRVPKIGMIAAIILISGFILIYSVNKSLEFHHVPLWVLIAFGHLLALIGLMALSSNILTNDESIDYRWLISLSIVMDSSLDSRRG